MVDFLDGLLEQVKKDREEVVTKFKIAEEELFAERDRQLAECDRVLEALEPISTKKWEEENLKSLPTPKTVSKRTKAASSRKKKRTTRTRVPMQDLITKELKNADVALPLPSLKRRVGPKGNFDRALKRLEEKGLIETVQVDEVQLVQLKIRNPATPVEAAQAV